jgi:2-oxoglutarate ferredoxin oxidoreductase subunit alpha
MSVLPEPQLFKAIDGTWSLIDGNSGLDMLIVGWGSTKSVVMDVLRSEEFKGKNVGYLHYTYLWPLKTNRLETLMKTAKKTVLVEGNKLGQLGLLIRQQSGLHLETKILKYDGRPFYYDELLSDLQSVLPA